MDATQLIPRKHQILVDLQRLYFAASDTRSDGFTTWEYKKDLHELKFALEDMLHQCPTYASEPAWLREQEAEKIVRILKK